MEHDESTTKTKAAKDPNVPWIFLLGCAAIVLAACLLNVDGDAHIFTVVSFADLKWSLSWQALQIFFEYLLLGTGLACFLTAAVSMRGGRKLRLSHIGMLLAQIFDKV